jgi:hypothetical protein
MAVDLSLPPESYPGYKTKWGAEQYHFSAQGTDLDHSKKADEVNGSGFGTEFENNLPGMKKGELKISGLAAMKRGRISALLDQWSRRSTPVNVWYATEGLSALAPLVMQPSSLTDNSIKTKLKDSVQFDSTWSARGAVDMGVILLSPKTLLTPVASGSGPVDDNTSVGGATTFGGVAQLHVLALNGGTTPAVTVKVQHSSDSGTTWTDLGTFPAVTAVGSWRLPIASTTTVNAQVKASWTATGTPTEVQVLLGFARGVDPDS